MATGDIELLIQLMSKLPGLGPGLRAGPLCI